MTTIRIRGLYAVALTQLFRQHADEWEIVQPDEEVKSRLDQTWRMVSPDLDISDSPDEGGRRETIRIAGSSEHVRRTIELLQSHCFDVITHLDSLQVGAVYQGLVGIVSRVQRRATVYLGNQLVGFLPMRYEDGNLKVGTFLPVRIAALPAEADGSPELSTSITVPGHHAVLTSTEAVRLSKQITDPQHQERLQRLGDQLNTGDWGIIWRTAAQDASDTTLTEEIRHLTEEANSLRDRLQSTTTTGYIQGGDVLAHVYLPGHAKAVCDTFRAQLLPTLPAHHKYRAQGDLYAATVDALEKELTPEELQTRTKPLSLLASVDAMQPPIQNQLRLVRRNLDGKTRNPVPLQRMAEDLQEGWVDVQHIIPNQDAYPKGLEIDRQRGDYSTTRFHEGNWSYVSHFYDQEANWKGVYAALTAPIAIFADELHALDLGVAVIHSPKQPPQCCGMDTLLRCQEQGVVSNQLTQKIQQEVEGLIRQFSQ
ncbi:MAG: ribonuclease E/G [bacterium]|nr:ribonuclease E/G [bacterium]